MFVALPLALLGAAMPSQMPDLILRVATYNIRHGSGMEGDLNLNRTSKAIGALKADIIGLQEVDQNVRRSGSVDQPAELGRLLGKHSAFGSFMDYDGGRYGLAILSKYPISSSKSLRLPEGNEPRVALAAEIQLPGGVPITVVNVHFDWVEDDGFRFAQANVVCDYLQSLKTPYVVLGDFNDVPESRTLTLFRKLAVEAKKAGSRFTFSAAKPEKEIDYLFFAPAGRWNLSEAKVGSETKASDHRPVSVSATFRLRG